MGRSGLKKNRDYHDYVFKDGDLLGDFDNMYKFSKVTPWEQDKRCDHWYTEVGMAMLQEKAPYKSILEIGCGLGYIAKKLGRYSKSVTAFDISCEAIKKARGLHKNINFYVDDITDDSFKPRRQYDLVVMKDNFWYVFKRMKKVIENINACVKKGGYLYLCQSFPALEKPFVEKEIIDSPQILIRYFSNRYENIFTMMIQRHEYVKDGPILHYFGRKK